MKKLIISLIVLCFISQGFCGKLPELSLKINLKCDGNCHLDSIKVDLELKNESDSTICVLDVFNEKGMSSFFYVEIDKEDGQNIYSSSIGKMQLRRRLKKVNIEKKGIFKYPSHLNNFMKNRFDLNELDSGNYMLKIKYYGRYTENCFNGIINSNVVKFYIAPKTLKIGFEN